MENQEEIKSIVAENEIDLVELFKIIWKRKIFIFSITLIFSILSILYSLSLQNIYQSRALLVPSEAKENMSSRLANYSSLAGGLGLNISGVERNKSQEAIERIKTLEFFSDFVLPNILLEDLLAVKSWDSKGNQIKYNKNLFNKETNKWVKKSNNNLTSIPSAQEAFKEYKSILSIEQDSLSSFITISINHKSPYLAKEWLDIIIFNINESMREEDKREASASINYLKEAASTTNVQSLKDAISNLLEMQMQTLMLASSNKDYVLKTINSPYVPEEKVEPSRAIICIFGALVGALFSIFIIIIQHYKVLLASNEDK